MIAERLALRAASALPPGFWARVSSVPLAVPYYHIVSDAHAPHVSHLYRFRDIRTFTADVQFLLAHFRPVSLADILEHVERRRAFKEPSFHLTFDDGFREMYDVVAPILVKLGVPATFFLNTSFLDDGGMAHHNEISVILEKMTEPVSPAVRHRIESLLPMAPHPDMTLKGRLVALKYGERGLVRSVAELLDLDLDAWVRDRHPYLSSEQVRHLIRQGFSIGAHSCDHPLYADLPLGEQLRQTVESMSFITQRFDVRLKSFAFPHTDTGVGEEFFGTVFSRGMLDLSFGTGGMISHFHPRNLERVSMEKTSAPAADILQRQYARAIASRFRSTVGF